MTNDAAERLRHFLTYPEPAPLSLDDLDAALAAAYQNGRQEAIDSFMERLDGLLEGERRATVERIRDAIKATPFGPFPDDPVWTQGVNDALTALLAILDAEADR